MEFNAQNLICIQNCSIRSKTKTVVSRLDFTMKTGECWLVTGPNGGGKADFLKALAGEYEFVPHEVSLHQQMEGEKPSLYSSVFNKSVAIVSLEEAAKLIEEERSRDESEILNYEDQGRTGRQYICEVLGGSSRKNAPLPPIASQLESIPQVKLCGIENILDRGLRYMSTGEIRRTLLCRAILSNCQLIILSDPFAGLDASSRKILLDFLDSLALRQLVNKKDSDEAVTFPRIILSMERFKEIPSSVNRVIEFADKKISFCGEKTEYESVLEERNLARQKKRAKEKENFLSALADIRKDSRLLEGTDFFEKEDDEETSLIKLEDVNVGWDDHKVLVNLNWEVLKGVHWLIRGPNGSGKTTLLELITGDNMQVFREKVSIFGKRRGSGETIWDIKKRLGIVSYRLHVEYRMVGSTTLINTIISGFHDSIGLYEPPTDFECAVAKQWLKLAGFAGRENEMFGSLSYGEQRAILILRAAVKTPKVLILDEPCHGLDESFRDKILDLLETIGSTGTTTLLHVTHDPAEVLECEKNILEFHPGEDPMYRLIAKD